MVGGKENGPCGNTWSALQQDRVTQRGRRVSVTATSRPASSGPPRVVVGVDGSPASGEALAWALADASRRCATLVAIHVWKHQPAPALPHSSLPSSVLGRVELELAARELLDRELAGAVGAKPEVHILRYVALGNAASILLAAAEGAEELVVGSRGSGGFNGLLLGSVSQQCSQYAPCPVVIVRPCQSRRTLQCGDVREDGRRAQVGHEVARVTPGA